MPVQVVVRPEVSVATFTIRHLWMFRRLEVKQALDGGALRARRWGSRQGPVTESDSSL